MQQSASTNTFEVQSIGTNHMPSSKTMDTAAFLSKILSDEGLICVPEFRNGAMKRQHFSPNFDAASAKIKQLNDSGAEVYHGCATYKTDEGRKQSNVARVKCFWLDIDVGKPNSYATRNEAKDALQGVCKALNFHVPMIVSSGAGLHCYWLFDAGVSGEVWKAGAQLLRQALDSLSFLHDPSRTTDQASILRPVGSTWRKAGERPVKLLVDSEPLPFGEYINRLNTYLSKSRATVIAPLKKYAEMFPLEKLGGKTEYPPSSANKIANQCKQLANMRDFKGAVSEPEWRNSIGVIKHTIEGDELCHEWSSGDPRYDYEETQTKIDRWETGPTTCDTFERIAPHLCNGCAFKGKVKSPIQLGYETYVDIPSSTVEKSDLPRLGSAAGLISFSDTPPPPRKYVLEDLILAAKVCVLAGIGGVSKTMLAMIWAVHIALGLPWNGMKTLMGSVLLILGEEDIEEIGRRFNAIAKALKLTKEQTDLLHKRIRAFPMNGLDSRLTKNQGGSLEGTDFTFEIIAACKNLEDESGVPVRLTVLDHAGLIHGGEFNSREDVVQTMRQVNYIAEESSSAILVLAHSPKASMSKDKADASDVAGSTAWVDLARSVEVLRPMDETEGKALGVDPELRKEYVSLSIVKNNYGPTGDKFWLHRKMVENYSVSVLNPVELVKPIATAKGGEQLQARILSKISTVPGQYSKSGFRDNFSGKTDSLKASKSEVGLALDEMLKSGALLLREPTPAERKQFGLHHTTKQVLDLKNEFVA